MLELFEKRLAIFEGIRAIIGKVLQSGKCGDELYFDFNKATDRAPMAPHVWQGMSATDNWYRDVLSEGKQHNVSDYFITLGEPLHNNVTGDSAYVVVPATMTFKSRGKQFEQSGAIYTVALRKEAAGWRIAAWAWAKGTPR